MPILAVLLLAVAAVALIGRPQDRESVFFTSFALLAWGFLEAASRENWILLYLWEYPLASLVLVVCSALAAACIAYFSLSGRVPYAAFVTKLRARYRLLQRRLGRFTVARRYADDAVLALAILVMMGLVGLAAPVLDVPLRAAQQALSDKIGERAAALSDALDNLIERAAKEPVRGSQIDYTNALRTVELGIANAEKEALDRLGTVKAASSQVDGARARTAELARSAREKAPAELQAAASARVAQEALAYLKTKRADLARNTMDSVLLASAPLRLEARDALAAAPKPSRDEVARKLAAEALAQLQKAARTSMAHWAQMMLASKTDDIGMAAKRGADDGAQLYARAAARDISGPAAALAQQLEQQRPEGERRAAELERLDKLKQQANQAKRDAEERERLRNLEEEKRTAEARTRKEAEYKILEENLAHLGFVLERFTRLSSWQRQAQGYAGSMEDCATQCLKTSWCAGFAYRAGQCFQAAESLRQYNDPLGEYISGRKK